MPCRHRPRPANGLPTNSWPAPLNLGNHTAPLHAGAGPAPWPFPHLHPLHGHGHGPLPRQASPTHLSCAPASRTRRVRTCLPVALRTASSSRAFSSGSPCPRRADTATAWGSAGLYLDRGSPRLGSASERWSEDPPGTPAPGAPTGTTSVCVRMSDGKTTETTIRMQRDMGATRTRGLRRPQTAGLLACDCLRAKALPGRQVGEGCSDPLVSLRAGGTRPGRTKAA